MSGHALRVEPVAAQTMVAARDEPVRERMHRRPRRRPSAARELERTLALRGPDTVTAPPSVARALRKPARPLPQRTRAAAEGRHGTTFADVRVRSDEDSTRDLRAAAYTVGADVVFAPGARTEALLEHELTHVLHQRAAAPADGPLEVVPDSHPTEREARRGVARTRLQRRAVQRAPEGTAKDDDFEPSGGAYTVSVLASPLGVTGFLAEEFTTGLVLQLKDEEKKDGRVSRLIERFEDIGYADEAKYGGGAFLGLLWGIVSPIVDVVKAIVALVQFAYKATTWVMQKIGELASGEALAAAQETVSEIAAELITLGREFSEYVASAIRHPLDTVRMIGSLADVALHRLFTKAREIGRKVAHDALELFDKPWFDIGFAVGYAAGAIAIQVVLLVFSEGIGNALSKLAKAIGELGTIGAAIVRGVRLAIEALAELGKVLVKMVKWVAGTLGELAGRLGRTLERLGALLERLLPRLEQLEPETAGAPGGGAVLMSSTEKKAATIVPRDPKKLAEMRPPDIHPSKAEVSLESTDAAKQATKAKGAKKTIETAEQYVANLRRRYPKLAEADLRTVARDVSQPGLYEERTLTGSQTQLEARWGKRKSRRIRFDDINEEGKIVDSKVRESGRQYSKKEIEHTQHEPDVYEQMTGEGPKPRSKPWEGRLPEKDEKELADQVNFALEHDLNGVEWRTTSARYKRQVEQVIEERGWNKKRRGFVSVMDVSER